MQITVLGSSGKVGSLVVEQLLVEEHVVIALVHKTNPYSSNPSVRVVKGDATNVDDVRNAIRGSDAVICALGSWGTRSKDIVSRGTQAVIEASDGKPLRFISVTGSGALLETEKPPMLLRLQRAALKLIAGKILADGEDHLKLLGDSNLSWTCLRSPVMTPGQTTKYKLTENLLGPWAFVTRRAVAKALVGQLSTNKYIGKAPSICS